MVLESGFSAFLICLKKCQCRHRWIMSSAAKIRLMELCNIIHWLRLMPRYSIHPVPLPPPEGNTNKSTSPEISDGINVIRQEMSTSAFIAMRFMKTAHGSVTSLNFIKLIWAGMLFRTGYPDTTHPWDRSAVSGNPALRMCGKIIPEIL